MQSFLLPPRNGTSLFSIIGTLVMGVKLRIDKTIAKVFIKIGIKSIHHLVDAATSL